MSKLHKDFCHHLQAIKNQSKEHKEVVVLKVLHISHYPLRETWKAGRGAEISCMDKQNPWSYILTALPKPFFGSWRCKRNWHWNLEHTAEKAK
jgi:hypothetical protein